MKTREQYEFQKLGDRQTGRHQARETRDTGRPLLKKQAHPEYDQIGVWVAYSWHVLPIRVNIVSISLIRVLVSTGEMQQSTPSVA